MKCDVFLIETPDYISNNDLKNLRKLYLPIIGVNSCSLFEYLVDVSSDGKLFNANEISNHLQITAIAFSLAIENLEAVGLLTTYQRKDESTLIYSISRPLDIETFEKNPILKTHLVKIIGKSKFDNWYYEQKKKFINKSSYNNISKKYQEVFADVFEEIIVNDTNSSYTTMDLVVDTYETHEENIEKLPSNLFIKYMLNRNANYYETQLINSLLNLGFSDSSINLFIDFSLQFNNMINCPYISKVAQDFRKRSICSFDDVKHELLLVANYKNGNKNKININTSSIFFNTHDENTNKKEATTIDFKSTITEIDPRDLFSDEKSGEKF